MDFVEKVENGHGEKFPILLLVTINSRPLRPSWREVRAKTTKAGCRRRDYSWDFTDKLYKFVAAAAAMVQERLLAVGFWQLAKTRSQCQGAIVFVAAARDYSAAAAAAARSQG